MTSENVTACPPNTVNSVVVCVLEPTVQSDARVRLTRTGHVSPPAGLVNGHVMRLGLVRSRSGRWLWEDGTEPRYTNWLQAPPPPDRRPLCAVIDGRRGGWAVQDCDNTVPSYCEAVPGGYLWVMTIDL